MKKIISLALIAMMATATVSAADFGHDKCKKECCKKNKEACKEKKCDKAKNCAGKSCDEQKAS